MYCREVTQTFSLRFLWHNLTDRVTTLVFRQNNLMVRGEIGFDVSPTSQWTSDFSRESLAQARRPEFCFKVEIVLLLLGMTGYQGFISQCITLC